MKLTLPAEAGIYFGLDKLRGIRAVASVVLCRYARDIAAGWQPRRDDWQHIHKIRARWQLPIGLMEGMVAAYKQDREQAAA